MRRRQAFTLVELLVAMALIIFIMAILSQAFVSAMTTFRNLKASGDMAEKLRATTQLLQRDLAADHFEGKKRLSDPNFWLNGPPQQGFFNIWQDDATTTVNEGNDLDGIASYRNAYYTLAFTVKLRGNQMGDFMSASGGMAALSGQFGPPEARYQVAATSGASYNYQWAEIDWFMQPSGDTTAPDQTTGTQGVPLYNLYRRQRLLVPDNNLVQPQQPAGNASQFYELSYWQPQGANGALYFNSPMDITVPQRRVMGVSSAYAPLPQGLPNLTGSDIQLTDVVSLDVRMLVAGATGTPDPFVTLYNAPFTNYTYTAPPWIVKGMVFDTWSSVNDGLHNYSQWSQTGNPGTSVPFWNATTQSGPIIQAIQISIRIWDVKTNQTRQVTVVQAM